MKDFFISYNKADRDWATWVAWTLEKAGYSVVIQAWDFRPGGNFVLGMQDALGITKNTLMILSEDYLKSSFTAPEWAAVFAEDPQAKERKLVPIRVRDCRPQGLLASLVYVDLIGLSQDAAEAALMGAFSARAKPSTAPTFPGQPGFPLPIPQASFPGPSSTKTALSDVLRVAVSNSGSTSPQIPRLERLKLNQQLNGIPAGQFNMLSFALSPPPGIVRPMPAPQAERSSDLLNWAEGPSGCGLTSVVELLEVIVDPH